MRVVVCIVFLLTVLHVRCALATLRLDGGSAMAPTSASLTALLEVVERSPPHDNSDPLEDTLSDSILDALKGSALRTSVLKSLMDGVPLEVEPTSSHRHLLGAPLLQGDRWVHSLPERRRLASRAGRFDSDPLGDTPPRSVLDRSRQRVSVAAFSKAAQVLAAAAAALPLGSLSTASSLPAPPPPPPPPPPPLAVETASAADCGIVFQLGQSLPGVFRNASCVSDGDCCLCTEVTCRDGRVVSLSSSSLTSGFLPPDLFNLTALDSLRLVGQNYAAFDDSTIILVVMAGGQLFSQVAGPLPAGPLPTNLSSLVLYGAFVGQIPDSWWNSRLLRLTRLQVAGQMVGSLRYCFGCLFPSLSVMQICGQFGGFLTDVSVGGLPSLTVLSLEGNFGGVLPDLSLLSPNLIFLDLGGVFAGPVPAAIGRLSSLTALRLFGQFTGTVPDVFDGMENISVLILSGQFSGVIPPSISSLTGLQILNLLGQFRDPVPMAIARMTQLQDLQVRGQFADPIPEIFSNLSRLVILEMIGQFSGSLPESLWNLTGLVQMELGGDFSGGIPDDRLSRFSAMQVLFLLGPFAGNFPSSVCRMTNLTALGVVAQVGGEVPCDFSKFAVLTELKLVGNFGGILAMARLPPPGSLRIVLLEGYFVFEGILDLTRWPSLQYFSLDGDLSALSGVDFDRNSAVLTAISLCCQGNLSAPSVADLAAVASLVDVSQMRINGSVIYFDSVKSRSLFLDRAGLSVVVFQSQSETLQLLSATNNQLIRVDGISLMTNLLTLDLSFNNLSGVFPIFSDSCNPSAVPLNLTFLDISANRISGLGWMGDCPFYQAFFVNMSNNDLQGVLPPALPVLINNVRVLDMSFNNFSGPMASEYTSFTGLRSLDLTGNPYLMADHTDSALFFVQVSSAVHVSPDLSYECPNLFLSGSSLNISLLVDDVSAGFADCRCLGGFFGSPPGCLRCSVISPNAHCPGGGVVLAENGYWLTPPYSLSSLPRYMIPCKDVGVKKSICVGSEIQVCAAGHDGRLCAGCVADYYKIGSECFECSGNAAWHAILACLFVVALVAIGCYGVLRERKFSKDPILQILMELLQNLSIMTLPFFGRLSGVSAVATVPLLRFGGFSCYFSGWDYAWDVYSVVIVAAVLQGLAVLGFLVAWKRVRLRLAVVRLVRQSMWLYQLCFLGVVVSLMSPWLCEYDPGLHQYYIQAQPNVQCSPALAATTGVCFVLFIVAPCTLYFVCIWRADRSIRSESVVLQAVAQFAVSRYKADLPFWDIWFLGRRILFGVAYILVPTASLFSTWLLWVLLIVSLVLDIAYRPHRRHSLNQIQLSCWLLLMMNLGSSERFRVPATTDHDPLAFMMIVFDVLAVLSMFAYWFVDWKYSRSRSLPESHQAHKLRNSSATSIELSESLLPPSMGGREGSELMVRGPGEALAPAVDADPSPRRHGL